MEITSPTIRDRVRELPTALETECLTACQLLIGERDPFHSKPSYERDRFCCFICSFPNRSHFNCEEECVSCCCKPSDDQPTNPASVAIADG